MLLPPCSFPWGGVLPVRSDAERRFRLVGLPRSFGTLTGLTKLYINNNPALEMVFSPDQIKLCGYSPEAVRLVVGLCGERVYGPPPTAD